jgi:CSLREA domain-containing protein
MKPGAVLCCWTGIAFLFVGLANAQRAQDSPVPQVINFPYFVNSTSDAGNNTRNATVCDDGTGHCTLRGAIQAANANAGADVINIALVPGSVINLGSALPNIAQALSINGPTAGTVTVRRNSAASYSVFTVTAGPVSFSGLTIANGNAGNGGGIKLSGTTVNVTNCVFLGNGATNGGGIYNDGATLNVTNCTFTGNGAGSDGGGIANDHYGTANVSNSTFTGNTANNGDSTASGGGAICNGDHNHSYGGYMTVTNATITGNTALRGGGLSIGGAAAAGFLTVTNSTIVGNSSFFGDSAGGISSDGQGPVNIKNTIVALNTGAAGRDVYGGFVSSGFNLIGKTDGSTGFTQATDQVGTIASPLDPKLDPAGLQNNGGPTQTIALQPGSPALDKGTSSGLTGNLTTDQRGNGFPRNTNYSNIADASSGDGTDIGACEGTALKITAITQLTNDHILLQGLGAPGLAHRVEAAADPNANSFNAVPDPITADGTGALQFEDAPQPTVTQQFYRLRFP